MEKFKSVLCLFKKTFGFMGALLCSGLKEDMDNWEELRSSSDSSSRRLWDVI